MRGRRENIKKHDTHDAHKNQTCSKIEDLKKFESVSNHLQAGGAERLNLGSARSLFQALYDEFETRHH